MLKKGKKTKKSSRKGPKEARKALKSLKVKFSGKRHFEALAKLAKDHPMYVYDILSAIRGPDKDWERETSHYKEDYTGVIRTWLFGTEGCGGMMQSAVAPVTAEGWEKLLEEVTGKVEDGDNREHFLGHIQTAFYAIAALYQGSLIFKEGT